MKHINEMNLEEVRSFIQNVLRPVDRRNADLPLSVLAYAFDRAEKRLRELEAVERA